MSFPARVVRRGRNSEYTFPVAAVSSFACDLGFEFGKIRSNICCVFQNIRCEPFMNREFIERLNTAFENASMADVARRLKIPHATVRNYYQGRLPAPEVLIKIANETGVSLNWLLIGTGDKYAGQVGPIGLGKFIEEKIGEIIEQKLAAKLDGIQDLGTAD